jgi:DNA-binding transcriptional MerR regulator
MKEYSTKDIANIVSIAAPTVRKYAQVLEKAGYVFTKNENGFRVFTDSDIEIFEQMKSMSNESGMNVERIALILVNQRKQKESDTIQSKLESATLVENEAKKAEISDIERDSIRYEALMKEIQELKQIVVSQQRYIDERLSRIEKRSEERDRRWMEYVREQQQAKLETSTSTEDKKKRRGILKRLFSWD